MRIVIQRVANSRITINATEQRDIGRGLMVLLGIHSDDSQEDIEWIARKLLQLRIFPDESGVMNKSVSDVGGDLLIVSQFTLYASTKKGNRPSYINAAPPDIAIPLYDDFIDHIRSSSKLKIVTGEFGADMSIELTNDGPVTIIIDSHERY